MKPIEPSSHFAGRANGHRWGDRGSGKGRRPDAAPSGTPSISFYCDAIAAAVAGLSARGGGFTGPVEDHGYGLVTHVRVPGGFAVQLDQPKYAKG